MQQLLVAAIHGIMTGQTRASWPDEFDAWMWRRDPSVKVLKKEYRAGPFPRWNVWVKDPWLARGLANEIDLFCETNADRHDVPRIWLIGHSNGAVIALMTAKRLMERGYDVDGLILTGAACEECVIRSGIERMTLGLHSDGAERLGRAIAYSCATDSVVKSKLIWPYGHLGRTGFTVGKVPFCNDQIFTRWFDGVGHSGYFDKEHIHGTFEQFYQDLMDVDGRGGLCGLAGTGTDLHTKGGH